MAKRACLRRAKTRKARVRCVVAARRKPVVTKKPVVKTPAPAATQVPVPAVAVEAPAADGPVVADAPAAPAAPACDPSPWLLATAEDANGAFRLRLSRSCVPAGKVLVNYVNKDAQPHNLYVEGVSPAVAARKVIGDVDGPGNASGSAELTAGTWRVFCAIPGHEAMTKTIEVTQP